MRHRGTIEQGLTFKQIFCEVYSDVVEKYVGNMYDSTGELMLDNIEHISDEIYQKVRYLRRVIKQVRETDEEFRWLSPSVPIKTNKIDKTTGKKLRPYVEYRHINVKASETPDLLDEVLEYWNKRSAP